MLAERRQKVRYILNPKKCSWSADDNNLGRRLMQRMGWSDGKGLGRAEQGAKDPIKVSYKNDSKGMGYKGAPDCPVKQQEDFSQLLAELNQTEGADSMQVSTSLSSSLEKRSETSRSRLHYHKFTRGKDLSRYTEKDLACIIGNSNKTQEKMEDTQLEKDTMTFGIPTTNGGLISEYFKLKMQAKSKNNATCDSNNASVPEVTTEIEAKVGKKKKNRRKLIENVIEESDSHCGKVLPSKHKSKKKRHAQTSDATDSSDEICDSLEYQDNKGRKKRKKCKQDINDVPNNNVRKKKHKKEK